MAEQVPEAGHHTLLGVPLDRRLLQAVGGEEEELVRVPVLSVGRSRGQGGARREVARRHGGDDGEDRGQSADHPADPASPSRDR